MMKHKHKKRDGILVSVRLPIEVVRRIDEERRKYRSSRSGYVQAAVESRFAPPGDQTGERARGELWDVLARIPLLVDQELANTRQD